MQAVGARAGYTRGKVGRTGPEWGSWSADLPEARENSAMSSRMLLAVVTGANLLLVTPSVIGRFEPLPAGNPAQEDPQRDRESRGAGDRPQPVRQFQQLRQLLEEERMARRQAEERLAKQEEVILDLTESLARTQAELEELREVGRPAQADGDRDRDRERAHPERREGVGQLQVAEAGVEAARARMGAAESRLDASRERMELTERLIANGTASVTEGPESRMALAEAEAGLAEARARLIEAEYHLAQAARGEEGDGRNDGDRPEEPRRVGDDPDADLLDLEQHDHGIELEDVIDTADRILELIRRVDEEFNRDENPTPFESDDEEIEIEIEVEARDTVDEVIDTAGRILDLIQSVRRDRFGQ
jgi:hypothetical protein